MIHVNFAQIELRIAMHIVGDAVTRYDALGGLANDTSARHTAIRELAAALEIPDFPDAAELLADALARRAASKP